MHDTSTSAANIPPNRFGLMPKNAEPLTVVAKHRLMEGKNVLIKPMAKQQYSELKDISSLINSFFTEI